VQSDVGEGVGSVSLVALEVGVSMRVAKEVVSGCWAAALCKAMQRERSWMLKLSGAVTVRPTVKVAESGCYSHWWGYFQLL